MEKTDGEQDVIFEKIIHESEQSGLGIYPYWILFISWEFITNAILKKKNFCGNSVAPLLRILTTRVVFIYMSFSSCLESYCDGNTLHLTVF